MPKSRHLQADHIHAIGLKATVPRLKVLELFKDASRHHLSAEEIYRSLTSDGSEMSLATIYRVLIQFEQAGLLVRHHFESGKAVFELKQGEHHDHLICLVCGRVEEFCDDEIERLQHAVAEARGYRLHEHALALYGVCADPECQARQDAVLPRRGGAPRGR